MISIGRSYLWPEPVGIQQPLRSVDKGAIFPNPNNSKSALQQLQRSLADLYPFELMATSILNSLGEAAQRVCRLFDRYATIRNALTID